MKRILLVLTTAMLCTFGLYAQTKITGTVVDKNNQPLMGVQVMPEAGGDAVTTDFDGKFEITVPEGTKLTFSMLGAKAKTEVAADRMVVIMGVKGSEGADDWKAKRWNNILMAEYGFNAMSMNAHSIGIRYGQCKYVGWYVGARYVTSDFKFPTTVGTLDNDGLINDPAVGNGRPIMTGVSCFNQFSASVGFLWRMGIPLYGYVGGGYGYRMTYYQTNADQWLKKQSDSPHLGLAEIGFIGDIHYITLSIGCELVFTNSIEVYPKIGIGYTFPMSKSNKGGNK